MNEAEEHIDLNKDMPAQEYDHAAGELILRTAIANQAHNPWWRMLPAMMACGALMGLSTAAQPCRAN